MTKSSSTCGLIAIGEVSMERGEFPASNGI